MGFKVYIVFFMEKQSERGNMRYQEVEADKVSFITI